MEKFYCHKFKLFGNFIAQCFGSCSLDLPPSVSLHLFSSSWTLLLLTSCFAEFDIM